MKLSYFFLGLFVFILVSCGGGSKGGDTVGTSSSLSSQTYSPPPNVTINSPLSVEINDVVTVTANAMDASGVVTYSWVVEAGPAITLSDSAKAQVSFTAPNVTQDTDVTLAITVTNKSGVSTKVTTKIIILSKKSALTINGLVTHPALANADVVVTIRDLTFKTKSDSSGHYSMTLAIDEGHLYDPVTIVSQGFGAQVHIKLASLLKSASALYVQAGADKILDASENFSVNLTALSTAEYALATSGYVVGISQFIPANDLLLENAFRNISTSTKFELAAVIQLVAYSDWNLPEGTSSTLDLAFSPYARSAFVSSLYPNNNGLIEKTVNEIINNKEIVREGNDFKPGKYILESGECETSGVLLFESNLTGKLDDCEYGELRFTWQQNGTEIEIKFDSPVEIVGSDPWGGKFFIKTATLAPSYGFMNANSGGWAKNQTLVDIEGSETDLGALSAAGVRILSEEQALKVDRDRFTGNFVDGYKNYEFNQNGTLKINLLTSPEVVESATWSIEENRLVISNSNGSAEYYFTRDLGVGFSFTQVNDNRGKTGRTVFGGIWVKPQEGLNVNKSDMVGTWVGGSSLVDVWGDDDLIVTNFGAWTYAWNFIDGQNMWEINYYNQDLYESNIGCNLASKSPCNFYVKNEHKVIARTENIFFVLSKQVYYDSNGSPSTTGWYSLHQQAKLPKIDFFGNWILQGEQHYFQQTLDGIKVWNFSNNHLKVTNKSLDFWQFNQEATDAFTIINGKLRYSKNNVKREMELISATSKGLIVCEYDEGRRCDKGTEFMLSNRSPVNISLSVVGSGSIQKTHQTAEFTFLMYGNKASYNIVPDSGYSIQSVTGCGGELSYGTYTTSEIRKSCSITATFVKN